MTPLTMPTYPKAGTPQAVSDHADGVGSVSGVSAGGGDTGTAGVDAPKQGQGAGESPLPAPGLHLDVPFEVYRSWPAINASLLHGYARSPLHARHEQLNPRDSAERALGTAAHAAILEPDVYRQQYVPKFRHTGPSSREANAARVRSLAARGVTELDEEDVADVGGMLRAVMGHPLAGTLVATSFARESSALWIDPETGVPCKARFDLLVELKDGRTAACDLKTCRSVSPRSFQRDAIDYGYYVSSAWYLGGLAALQPGFERSWLWIAVESSPPHDVVVYRPDEDLLLRGWQEARRLLALHLECSREQKWPGLAPDAPVTLSAPRWL